MAKVSDWIDARLGHRALLHAALQEPVSGGARWAYVFGSGLVVLFGMQAITGIALAAYYAPSTRDAWASVSFLQTHVFLGWLLRGMHHYGASAMVLVLAMHLLQTVWYGAFKSPRELNWLAGFLLLALVLAFALTGYLLPWDQKGYWATQVATSIAGTLPLVGSGVQRVLQGGSSYGNWTLTRFYSVHVLVLPALLTFFLAVHLYLFRRHGVTPPPRLAAEEAARLSEPFFPRQLFRDSVFSLGAVGAVLAVAWFFHGAPLEGPADPSSQYLARPEWYFLPLFQVLKYFEGRFAVIGTVVVPSVAMGFVALLPFAYPLLKRRVARADRWLAGILTAGLAGAVALGMLAMRDDRANPSFRRLELQAARDAAQAQRLAQNGVPATGPLDLYLNDPVVHGERVFEQQCRTCHHVCETQPYKGDPCLDGYASRGWLTRIIRDPQSPYFFGNDHIDEMDPWKGDDATLAAIVEFLYAQADRPDVNSALATRGKKLFESEGCGGCHMLDGRGSGDAPDLQGYAGVAWLSDFILHPGGPRFYGSKNVMKVFKPGELTDAELKAVVAFLRSKSVEPMKFP